MKRTSRYISIFIFLINHAIAQKDTGFFENIIVKINPTLIGTAILQEGEYGGVIQIPLFEGKDLSSNYGNMDVSIGYGYNKSFDPITAKGAPQPNGTGYTIRGGIYYFLKKENISFQFFQRRWNINGIYDLGKVPGDPEDNIISPSTLISSEGNLPIYYLDNAVVNVYSADVVFGNQFPHHRKLGHLFFEWFIGAGIRYKAIDIEELGSYDPNTAPGNGNPGIYYPLQSPIYFKETKIYPDFKLGFMVGFIL